ncbi:MAG TPA: serpin family protein [Oscillatoriales cyanobacterium M59_W2019_021]|nr:MAG: serpin family protein [Cyanobacteria bacterium J055]HIK33503.1 serpin family protein [Oscillatoriales cyanobacterium M4454_W2019_049]HIK51793.1 serpin family protein [Oscillatoriales cyanobacterium M59_W2019_021]
MYSCLNLLKCGSIGIAIALASSLSCLNGVGAAVAVDGELPRIASAISPDIRLADRPSDVAAIVEGNTAFACDLYRQLSTAEGNLFFSPYSISNALAMTYAGARGETAAEMERVLHFSLASDRLHPAFAELIEVLEPEGTSTYELAIANRLWGQQNYGFLPEFLNLLERHYAAPLQEVDFINATEDARTTINAWVAQQTQNNIQNLLPAHSIDPSTQLVLTNAIYFKGNWLVPFDASATQNQPFHLSSAETIEVPMMHQMEYWNYADLDGLQVLELPYEGETLSMVILLPTEIDGLAALERQLTPENLQAWLSSARDLPMMMDGSPVSVWLPRFKLTSAFELKNTLSEMGMPQAFGNTADFSGMTGQPDLAISQVIHKAFVDVNEQGTEAAAATAVAVTRGGSNTFRVDRPFVFFIYDRNSSSVLFLGRVVNPLG